MVTQGWFFGRESPRFRVEELRLQLNKNVETTKDSIQYVRPFWSKTANGHDQNDKDATYGGNEDEDYDPWNYSKGGKQNCHIAQ